MIDSKRKVQENRKLKVVKNVQEEAILNLSESKNNKDNKKHRKLISRSIFDRY